MGWCAGAPTKPPGYAYRGYNHGTTSTMINPTLPQDQEFQGKWGLPSYPGRVINAVAHPIDKSQEFPQGIFNLWYVMIHLVTR